MSRKLGYILAEEARMRAKETAHRSYDDVDFVAPEYELVGEFIEVTAVGDIEESKLTEYVNRCLANIDLARQRMSNDQIEIDRLREETRSLIAELLIA